MELNEFCDAYILEMVQQEIEIEKKIFQENISLSERLQSQLVAILSHNLAQEIDNEILNNLGSSFGCNITSYIDNNYNGYTDGDVEHTLSNDGRILNFNIQLRPINSIENIIIDFKS